jgi:hypothetical protein
MSESEQPADKERYQASMAWLWEILTDISNTATEVSTRRCPYKNAQDLCTAGFGCRNQRRTNGATQRPVCVGSDDLDYRGAWES